MEIKASAKYLRISPRKLRLLTKGLRSLTTKKALERLSSYPQGGTELLVKTIQQAVANATNNFKQEENSLKIKTIEVGEGPSFKRMDKSHGARFDRGIIKKRTAHLFLTLESKEEKVKPDSASRNKEKTKEVIKKNAEGKLNPPSLNPPAGKAGLRRTRGTKS